MTAVEIATGIIDKLQQENKRIVETLHKAQDTIKYSERQLAEKDRVINLLEERIRAGNDGMLEMTIREKELTIKHLEMQIKDLLQENEDLEVGLEAVKAEICPKCETKLLLNENRKYTGLSKSYKQPGKSSSALLGKKSSQTICPDRVRSLEKVLEYKDERINHLSKEVQRLTKIEKDLTQKIYRLLKLLPMSHLPPSTIHDFLLQEIQQTESQIQSSDGTSEVPMVDILSKVNKPSTSYVSANERNISKSTEEKLNTSACSKIKIPALNLAASELTLGDTQFENEVLFNKLQKLCDDLNKFKRLFAFENEKLSHGLSSTVNKYRIFKANLEENINNLNKIIQNMFDDFNNEENDDLGHQSYDKYVISCLQNRHTKSLCLFEEYENKTLRKNLESKNVLSDALALEQKILQSKLDVAVIQIDTLEKSVNILQEKLIIMEDMRNQFQNELQEMIKKNNSAEAIEYVKELDVCRETIKALKAKLNSKDYIIQPLNSLIDMMRSKEFNYEMTLEQLKKEIQWLADKATATDSELYVYKEENCKMKSAINSMKRELMNEKYEKAKTHNELKLLKVQTQMHSQMLLDKTDET